VWRHKRWGAWPRVPVHQRRAGLRHENRLESIRYLTEAADLYRKRVGEVEKAGECLHRIVELDPDQAGAKRALAEMLAGTQQWEGLWPHVEKLAETIGDPPDASPEERREAYLQAGRCALELGKLEQALQLMDRAVAIDPGHVPVLLERADALYRTQAWEPAANAYHAVLTQHAAVLEVAQRAAAFR